MSIRDTGVCTSTSPQTDTFLLLSSVLTALHEDGVPCKLSSLGEGEVDLEWEFLVAPKTAVVYVTAWGDGDYECSVGGNFDLPDVTASAYIEHATVAQIIELIAAYRWEETHL